ncbi:BadF/BadG/BcrA/BcrD ATPase family protein [Lacrimispora sphenoides]|uniref:BadF-type ATPase n=1 Tax=Lacrimispora sphenoides JCM 1415 TaxID=1297793 RepID=A0ABY1C581_9FIRM|nr:BadF/BadG/BcrA/BcrD ATPase family protein [Lacrimispora sphenoides]SET67930.1 BadF-type ATPase [[Clostridium] sphenoides JCM 1415]SUY50440.1 BadF/BadG/BcrA/BcrD type ATPase [Lacrimispora sphenoides]
MKGYYAGLDIGGTNGRLKICGSDGEVLGEFTAPGCSLNTDGAEKSRLRYRDLVLPALQELHLDPGFCLGICVAASGIDSPSDEHDCRSSFEEMGFPHERLLVLNDCEVFLHMTEDPALVVISGTGSVCFGRDKKGSIYRTGGWNHIISDEGSGFDMGLKTLKAVGDDLSGRIKCPVLTPLIIKETGLDTLEKIDDFINANLMEKSEIARLSLFAYQAAALGDHEAVRIHRECGDALWGLIRDTKAKMAGKSLKDKLNLWLWGSVLVKNDIIRSMVEEKVRVGLPGTETGIPEMSALDTALKAARAQETERRTL